MGCNLLPWLGYLYAEWNVCWRAVWADYTYVPTERLAFIPLVVCMVYVVHVFMLRRAHKFLHVRMW